MVTTIKITGDGVFIQSNGGVGGGAGGPRLQQQQLLATADTLGSTAIGEANLPPTNGTVHSSNGSLDTVDSAGISDTNNNHKGYRNFNHRRYQSDEGPGFIGVRNGKSERADGGGSSGSSIEMASGESDDTIGDPDPSRKRDKFTISFLNTHRSSGGGLQNGGHGKSMLNHKFIVYNSKKPKTSSVLHQQYYQQSLAAAGELGNGSSSGSPPLPMQYQSHYQQYLYNRLRPSLSTSVLSSPSLISGTTAALGASSPLGRSVDRDRDRLEQQHQLYQNSLFHQQHRSLLGTPPAAVPGWAKSTSCLVTDSVVAATSSYRTVTASPLLLLPAQPTRSPPQPHATSPRPVPISSSISSLSSSPSSFSASSPPTSGASSSANTPPPPIPSEAATLSTAAVPATTTSTASVPATCSSPTPTTTSKSPTPPPTSTTAPSTPTHSSPPPSSTSNLDVDVRGVPRFDRSTKPAASVIGSDQQQQHHHQKRFQHQQRSFDLQHSESASDQQQQQQEEEDSLLVSRRNSTGSSVALNGMNSHTAAINLQHPGTGQTAVVGHHRGFSSTVVAAANSAAASASATDCPWFLPHQMPPPPTAPARQHKRPAPQPGGGVGGGGGGPGSHMQPPQFISPPPAPQQQQHHQQQPQQQHSQQPAIVPPPQLPPHTVNPSLSSIHHPVQQLVAAPQSAQSHQPPIPPHPAVHHIPKSPNQHHPPQQQQLTMQTSAVQQHSPAVTSAVGGVLTNNNNHHPTGPSTTGSSATGGLPPTTVSGNAAVSLMSASMNSAQLQGHILQPVGGLTGSALSLQQQQQQQQQSSIPPGTQQVHHMSNSLHGPIGIPSVVVPAAAGHDGSNGVGGVPAPGWNCVPVGLSSPTTSAAAAAQRRAEVNAKLNAMPWFHGRIKREEAESLLKPREDGLFLVRESTNFPGDYTLCVCFNEKVEHYRIKYVDNKLTIDDDEYFDHLGQLVEHYTLDSDGLCTKLMKALPKEEFCVKDFQDNGWEIKMEDLQLKENIGKGEFGDVMLGILKGEKVAVKVLKDAGRASNKFLAEAGVMTTLEHENLVKFIGLVFHDKYIYLVTEYMSKGSLVDYLRSRGRQHISRKDQINFAYDTCCGMEYLETKKVIHRDLAARNVLISEDCVAKVSDFGLARDERYTGDSSKLPIKWTAPEALKEGKFSNKTDMWSFGILLWEIYSFGRVPYPRIPLADVVKHVGSGYKMEAPEGCPPEIYEMMRQAWDLVPDKRPTFAELKRRLYNCKRETANTYVT
ncbi:mucin-5AC [Anopheles maculipalpis]|uniref:mucin-5AC n=1 Tax=Anopheles maculipalpis TaxID=1496333 RepID=UPI0021591C64|nr:mucin-5AC [Anopheles maculipalpis]